MRTAILLELNAADRGRLEWQDRFMQEGVDGLLRDKTRPSRIPPLGAEIVAAIVARTLEERKHSPSTAAG